MAGEKPKMIVFRGHECLADWPARLAEAQKYPFLRIDGKLIERVRYGNEAEDWGAESGPCHDCCAIKGELHNEGCDVERCPQCQGQLFSCGCNIEGPFRSAEDNAQ